MNVTSFRNTDGNNYQRLYSFSGQTNGDASQPIDNVILINGSLYGMTTEGAANGKGATFKVNQPFKESNSGAQADAAALTARPFEIRSITT